MLLQSQNSNKGIDAKPFSLYDTLSEQNLSLNELKGKKGTVIMFICNHCPYVIHVNAAIVQLALDYQEKGIAFVAISSNNALNYPQDGPEKMKENAIKLNYPFPYLYDKTQEIARAYQVECTPEFFVFNQDLKLEYHGQLDNSRPQQGIADGSSIRPVLDLLVNNKSYNGIMKPSVGCSIKWKK